MTKSLWLLNRWAATCNTLQITTRSLLKLTKLEIFAIVELTIET